MPTPGGQGVAGSNPVPEMQRRIWEEGRRVATRRLLSAGQRVHAGKGPSWRELGRPLRRLKGRLAADPPPRRHRPEPAPRRCTWAWPTPPSQLRTRPPGNRFRMRPGGALPGCWRGSRASRRGRWAARRARRRRGGRCAGRSAPRRTQRLDPAGRDLARVDGVAADQPADPAGQYGQGLGGCVAGEAGPVGGARLAAEDRIDDGVQFVIGRTGGRAALWCGGAGVGPSGMSGPARA